ncbi:hypothetical protein HELRODRAFT_170185 [Helobdella robusta]|uniref:Uncharacterized protein n=1 Tax=Helobdella robusta TaxID=6412 RepID=T1F2R8_HELRO|nr:hypothetical protein HELRODRAFT_170185 [Helobdella robusta]ESO07658.1 hypothetical protein HELRODRAFT_170185 [Helobdella robusta]
MAREFKLHHHVNELMTNLRVASTSEGPGAEVLTEVLEKSISPFVSTQVSTQKAIKKLSDQSNQPNEFVSKYEQLKSKNLRELDPLIHLMSRLSADAQIKSMLKKAKDSKSESKLTSLQSSTVKVTTQPQSTLSSEGLKKLSEEIQAELKKKTTKESSLVNIETIKIDSNKDKDKKGASKLSLFPKWIEGRPNLSLDFLPTNADDFVSSYWIVQNSSFYIKPIYFGFFKI